MHSLDIRYTDAFIRCILGFCDWLAISQRSVSECRANAQLMHSECLANHCDNPKEYEKVGTLSWAVSYSIIPMHYLQQPRMNKFIKLLRSVNNIKAGTLFLSLLNIVKLFSLIMQFIMAVSASYVYCFLLYAFYMNNIICVNYILQNCLVGCIFLSVSNKHTHNSLPPPPPPPPTHTLIYIYIYIHTHTLRKHTLTYT